jgi:hypothetical protein
MRRRARMVPSYSPTPFAFSTVLLCGYRRHFLFFGVLSLAERTEVPERRVAHGTSKSRAAFRVEDATLAFASGPQEQSDYVRRMEYRADCRGGIEAASWNGLRCEKSTVVAGMLRFISVAGRLLACTRTGKAIDSVRTTVKSFVALSVRDRSSGNSPATIAHNSRQTTAVTRIFPTSICVGAIVKSVALYTSRKQ